MDNFTNSPVKNDDVISRQAAIDALVGITMFKTKHEIMQRVNASVQDEQGWLGAIAECLDEIEDLPSAQPEIVRCKDCKHWTNNIGDSKLRNNYCNEAAHGFYYRCSGDDYCSFAERRTDG